MRKLRKTPKLEPWRYGLTSKEIAKMHRAADKLSRLTLPSDFRIHPVGCSIAHGKPCDCGAVAPSPSEARASDV